jgi:3-oxoacyl-(acyl-carrier-protein) synthase
VSTNTTQVNVTEATPFPTYPEDVVVTAIGVVTAGATTLDEAWAKVTAPAATAPTRQDRLLKGFPTAKHLADRRMLKAVSEADGIGLAAIEGLKTVLAFPTEAGKEGASTGPYDAWRMGLYVGSRPGSCSDNDSYLEAMEASRTKDGKLSEGGFGATCMTSRPTTLLMGLPNNVLCYGSMIIGAQGANSNYTSLWLGGLHALSNAGKRIERGQLDFAVGGGFSWHGSEPVNRGLLKKQGVSRLDEVGASEPYATVGGGPAAPVDGGGAVPADGAVFAALERRSGAEARGAKPLVTWLGASLACDARGPLEVDSRGDALESAVRSALEHAGIQASDVGLVLATGTALPNVDQCEAAVLTRVLADARGLPAFATLSPVFGDLMEGGGILELGFVPRLYEAKVVPESLRAKGAERIGFTTTIDPNRPCSLIVRASPWGEYACVVVSL